jgi:Mor family transcriptional regulator
VVTPAPARSPTPALDALIEGEPDFVDRIFEYLLSEFPQLAGPRLAEIKQDVRHEFSGPVYIPHTPPTARQQRAKEVLALFNGRNATEVARRLQISRATVYRLLKQEGVTKKPSQL